MDDDSKFTSSLKLITSAREIVTSLIDKYHGLSDSQRAEEWHDVPLEKWLLVLIHLYQTSLQQAILWWLGVAHGHLHLKNTVSMVREREDLKSNESPLVTRVIDFDRSKISVEKLAENRELYTLIDSTSLLEKIKSSETTPQLRLVLVLYLPLAAWDDYIFALLGRGESKAVAKVTKLASLRAPEELTAPDQYTRLAEFVYTQENNQLGPSIANTKFKLTLSLIKARPELIVANSELSFLSSFFQKENQDQLNAIDDLSQDQQILILASIYDKYQTASGSTSFDLNLGELGYLLRQMGLGTKVGKEATYFVSLLLGDFRENTVDRLINSSVESQSPTGELLSELIVKSMLLDSNEDAVWIAQNDLFFKLFDAGKSELLFSLLTQTILPDEKSRLIVYKNLRKIVDKHFEPDSSDQNITSFLKAFADWSQAVLA